MCISKKSWSLWRLVWLASLDYLSKHLEMHIVKVFPIDLPPFFKPRQQLNLEERMREHGQEP